MKQVVQSYKDGHLGVVEVPTLQSHSGHLLVRTVASLVSVGTEKHMLELARKSLVGKALARPDLVRQVMAKAQAEGILEAWRQAMGRLDTPVPLGYSSAGVVVDVGLGVEGFAVGDRVACAGSGYAGHTEVASVPANLCVKIPLCPPVPPTLGGTQPPNPQLWGNSPPRIGGPGGQFESAAFVALGSIALEAVRMARVSLGETVVVIGLGLLGQIAVQLLNAAGCHVIGMDINSQKAEMALQHGAEAVATDYHTLSSICRQRTANHGADAVIILAATPSNEPLEQAAELCRERGRIVAAGLVGLEIPRKPFYDKELELVISRAWGPGLYDPNYTEKGLDYPIAYARWTAKRNMKEFLAQLAKGTVRVDHLITHRFPFDRALEAYELILEGKEPYIGVLLEYGKWKGEEGRGKTEGGRGEGEDGTGKGEGGKGREEHELLSEGRIWLRKPTTDDAPQPNWPLQSILHLPSSIFQRLFSIFQRPTSILHSPFSIFHRPSSNLQSPISIGLVGAGHFATGTLLPAMKGLKGLHFRGVATATGLSARHTADKFGFDYCTTDYHELLDDPEIALVFILTRHSSHAHFVTEALEAGKHVFVEKPLALNIEQLREVTEAYQEGETRRQGDKETSPPLLVSPSPCLLVVGFNRRFSPFTRWLKDRFAGATEPLAVHCTVNAGPVPPDHWVHDPEQGGGRIIGEVCHFVDLIQFLTGSLPVRVYAETMGADGYKPSDNVTITLKMANGAVGSITYVAGGDKRYPRERVEVFGGGAVGVIENFKAATFTRGGRKQRKRNWLSVDRGHRGEVEALLNAIRNGGPAPVDFEEYVYTTLATFGIEESLRRGAPVVVDLA